MTDDPNRKLDRQFADLEGLKQHNQQRLAQLSAQGVSVNLLGQLVDAMITALFPEGTQERLDFLRGWEEKVSGLLADVEAEVRRQVLLAPGTQVPVPNGHRN